MISGTNMLRILCMVEIQGRKNRLKSLASNSIIPKGNLIQTGLKRKVPDTDSWCYASPWYELQLDTLDDEINSFLSAHCLLEGYLQNLEGIDYACLTICPVEPDIDEQFSCFLSHKTLTKLNSLGLALQIAPAESMPQMPRWASVS